MTEPDGELDAHRSRTSADLLDIAEPAELEPDELGRVLEALLLVVDTPVTAEALASATEQPVYRIAAKLRLMADELTERDSGIDLRHSGEGWRLYTRARFAPYVEKLLLDGARTKLTRAALETLGRGGLPPAGDARAGERGARGQRGRRDAHPVGARADHRGR